MHQCGGLQGLSGLLLRHPGRSQPAQFFIDQWKQLIRGLGLTRLNGVEQLGDVGHEREGRRQIEEKRVSQVTWSSLDIGCSWASPFVPGKVASSIT